MYLTSWGNRTPVTDWVCQMPSVFCQSVTILVLYADRTDRSSTRHELIHSGNFIRTNQIYWGTSGNTTSKTFTTMPLLTIFNPFLTRELRTTGFEGVPTEICLVQHVQTKTDRQHARQDRVLGDVSWTRGQCQKHECRSQQADVHGFEPQLERAVWQDGGTALFPFRTARGLRAL